MTDIFISYKREDRDYAKKIAENLISKGYSVWWDIELLPGDKFADEINIVLNEAKLIIVLWTPDSIQSNWVKSEATVGLKNNRLIPVHLRETEIPVPFNTLHSLDLTSWFSDQDETRLNSLVDSVSRKIQPSKKTTEKITEEEVRDELERPKHEVEFWASITTSSKQTTAEYQLYLDKYGESGSFSELAQSRLKTIPRENSKGPSLKSYLTVLSVLMGIAVGGFTIAQILGYFEEVPSEPVVVNGPDTRIKELESKLEELVANQDTRKEFKVLRSEYDKNYPGIEKYINCENGEMEQLIESVCEPQPKPEISVLSTVSGGRCGDSIYEVKCLAK